MVLSSRIAADNISEHREFDGFSGPALKLVINSNKFYWRPIDTELDASLTLVWAVVGTGNVTQASSRMETKIQEPLMVYF